MANPFPLQTEFTGMWRDSSRDQLPPGKLWTCTDMIPVQLGAPLRKRGGWTSAAAAFGASTSVVGIAYSPFAAGEKYVGVGSDGNAYQYTPSTATSLGAAFATPGDFPFHRTGAPSLGTLIITDRTAAAAPKSWDRTTYGALGGTPPLARYGTVWNDRTLLANGSVGGTAMPSRVWFGPAGNSASTWDTTNAWIDTATDVTGITTVGSSIIVFHGRSAEMIRGTTPPSSTTVGDLTLSRLFDVGCIDNRSITRYNDTVIWVDARGVYQTDGATLKDLTFVGGMRNYWRAMMLSYLTTWTIAAGIINDTLIVSVCSASAGIETLAYDLQRGYWWRVSNLPGLTFGRVGSTFEETHVGLRGGGYVAALSSFFSPASGNNADGNGTNVAPTLETGLFHGFMRMNRRWLPSHGIQNWKTVYVDYDLQGSLTPTISVSYVTDPVASTGPHGMTPILATTTGPARTRRHANMNSPWLGLQLVYTSGNVFDFSLYALEADYSPRETSRLS